MFNFLVETSTPSFRPFLKAMCHDKLNSCGMKFEAGHLLPGCRKKISTALAHIS
jgi:hypothetical protein